jgi:hypothetical protein
MVETLGGGYLRSARSGAKAQNGIFVRTMKGNTVEEFQSCMHYAETCMNMYSSVYGVILGPMIYLMWLVCRFWVSALIHYYAF